MTWISRFVLIAFICNILAPDMAYAQSQRRGSSVQDAVEETVDARLRAPLSSAADREELEQLYGAQLSALLDQYDQLSEQGPDASADLANIIEQMHALTEQYQTQQALVPAPQNAPVQLAMPDSATQARYNHYQQYDYSPGQIEVLERAYAPDGLHRLFGDVHDFLSKLENDELDWDDLLEYVDPLTADKQLQLTLTAYAGEVMNNDINALLRSRQIDPNVKEVMLTLLPRAQQRVVYRLNHLNDATGETVIAARSTLRILLFSMHRLYEAMGADDPLTTNKTTESYTEYILSPTRQAYNQAVARGDSSTVAGIDRQHDNMRRIYSYNQWKQRQTRTLRIHPGHVPAGWTVRENPVSNTSSSQTMGLFDAYMDAFLRELAALKADEKTKKGSANYQLLSQTLEYTVRYALLANHPEALPRIIDMFEEKPSVRAGQRAIYDALDAVGANPTVPRVVYNPTDFETPYGDIINSFFGLVASTLKGFPMDPQTATQTLAFLVDMTQTNHATNTRIGALEAAMVLNGHEVSPALPLAQQQVQRQQQALRDDLPVNRLEFNTKYPLNEQTRTVLAARTVDMYHPMQHTHYLAKRDYGLDSKQMQALSDHLATVFEGFLPVKAPASVWSTEYNRRVADVQHPIMLDRLNRGYDADRNGRNTYAPTFVFASDGSSYAMYPSGQNPLNQAQVEEENELLFVRIAGEAVLWVYLGQFLVYAYRAMQLTRGALSAAPAAWRAYNSANKGRKLLAASVKIRKGIRYNGLGVSSQAARLGTTITAQRVEQVTQHTVSRTALPARAGQTTVRTGETVSRTGTGYVTGMTNQTGTAGWKRRLWNWATGDVPSVERYVVETRLPGFQFVRAEVLPGATQTETNMRLLRQARKSFSQARMAAWRAADPALQKLTNEQLIARMMQARAQNPAWWSHLLPDEQKVLELENKILLSTSQALQADATAAGFNSNFFEYWAVIDGKWQRVSAAQFQQYSQMLRNGQVLAHGAKPMSGNYYEILGVSQDADLAAIKKAYRQAALQTHPDRLGRLPQAAQQAARERFLEVQKAYEELSDPAKRAAYDNGLLRANLGTSEDGFSLAITPYTGITPEGGTFNPITGTWEVVSGTTESGLTTSYTIPGLKGLGFKQANMTADISGQVSKHLIDEGQIGALGTLLMSNTPFVRSLMANLSFFTKWEGLDVAMYYGVQKDLTANLTQKIIKNEMDKYGDTFAAATALTGGQAKPDQKAYQLVQAAKRDNHKGALLVTPVLPFILTEANDETKLLLAINAGKIQLANAITKRQQARQNKNFDAVYQASLEELRKSQQIFELSFSKDPTAWAAVSRQMHAYYAQHIAALEQLGSGNATSAEKFAQLDEINQTMQPKQAAFLKAFHLKNLELTQQKLRDALVLFGFENDLQTLNAEYARTRQAMQNINGSSPKELARFTTLREEFLQTLKPIIKRVEFTNTQMMEAFNAPLVSEPQTPEQAKDTQLMYLELTIENWKEDFKTRGPQAEAAMNELCQNMRADIASAFRTATTIDAIEAAANDILNKYYKQARALAERYPVSQPPAGTGAAAPAPQDASAGDVYDELLQNAADDAGSLAY